MVKMEALLSIWIENQNQLRMLLSKMMIQNKARSIFNDIRKTKQLSNSENLENSKEVKRDSNVLNSS